MMKNPHPPHGRLTVLTVALGLMMLLFICALYNAQIINGSENRARSIASNATWQSVEASRGIITDRNGKVLVSNRLAYTLTFSKTPAGGEILRRFFFVDCPRRLSLRQSIFFCAYSAKRKKRL